MEKEKTKAAEVNTMGSIKEVNESDISEANSPNPTPRLKDQRLVEFVINWVTNKVIVNSLLVTLHFYTTLNLPTHKKGVKNDRYGISFKNNYSRPSLVKQKHSIQEIKVMNITYIVDLFYQSQ